eukprot:CAMPEP_0198285126 /NCGR_PEP_ID=MMETSP1449-20131203/4440_1 /TAXON_ID=420275 /ORGANISM="Attheya septentrionalis, Strain CCMP2084" /LENGTH=84 /DNA_ID=CAMNT_0043982397 /DNA_START=12 /DNA_END=263 /DNA_ORIENTATION=+
MTRSSAVRATDIEANDLGEDKLTSSRASTSIPFNNMRDDDEEEEDFFDAEVGCIHCNMTEDEMKNQKETSATKKPFSCSQLLPL